MPFTFRRLEIPDIVLIEPEVYGDERGFFLETYQYTAFAEFGIQEHFVQDNHSGSRRGVLRGLHFQKDPMAQGKLMRCLRGAIFDVAVDIRRGSPYFGKWVAVELSETNKHMLYVPPGFAHGFLVMSDVAEIVYKCTEYYAPADDRGIIWNDPAIGIRWPIATPILSDKDLRQPRLADADINFVYADSSI